MIITDSKRLYQVQEEFSKKFPNLKIEFYSKEHETNMGSPQKEKIDASKTIGEVRTIHKEGDLSINGHQKVSTFEQEFHDKFGLNVQVFRKSGNIWLQTTTTDDWTLADQNERGQYQSE